MEQDSLPCTQELRKGMGVRGRAGQTGQTLGEGVGKGLHPEE